MEASRGYFALYNNNSMHRGSISSQNLYSFQIGNYKLSIMAFCPYAFHPVLKGINICINLYKSAENTLREIYFDRTSVYHEVILFCPHLTCMVFRTFVFCFLPIIFRHKSYKSYVPWRLSTQQMPLHQFGSESGSIWHETLLYRIRIIIFKESEI